MTSAAIRRRRPLAAALAAALIAAGALASEAAVASKPEVQAAKLVLTLDDLGPGYGVNPGLTGPRTLKDVSQGDSDAIRKRLRKSWLGGAEHAFNGTIVRWGVVSLADVFRPSTDVGSILRAWQDDAVSISKGKRAPVPRNAPGKDGALIQGHLLNYELVIYIWRRGRAIASVDVTGPNGSVPVSFVMKLARAQDARVEAAGL
jgi:hypothetical protein